MHNRSKTSASRADAAALDSPRDAIGRSTPTQRHVSRAPAGEHAILDAAWGPSGPIQLDADQHTGLDDDSVRAAAGHGISGPGQPLPHLDAIQRSFGHHDVSGVRAHVGAQAREANAALGSNAYATGNDVVFATDSPSLHLAAHEAAHVVQQRGGVQLSSAVGQAGDSYEQHADAVAEKVVRGESAADLLAPYGGGSTRVETKSCRVQRKQGAEAAVDGAEAQAALQAVSRVLSGFTLKKPVNARYNAAVTKLIEVRAAIHDAYGRYDQMKNAVGRLAAFDRAVAALEPAIHLYTTGDAQQRAWVEKQVVRPLEAMRTILLTAESGERVRSTVRGKDGEVIELKDNESTKSFLKEVLPTVVQAARAVDDTFLAAAEDGLQVQVAALRKTADLPPSFAAGVLKTVEGALALIELTDEEFQKKLRDAEGVFGNVGSMADFLKKATEFAAGTVATSCLAAAGLAKLTGAASYAEQALAAATSISRANALSYITGGLDIVIGTCQLCTAKTTREKAEAVATIGGGLATVVCGGLIGGGLGGVLGAGIGLYLKSAVYLYFGGGDMAAGITIAWMSDAFVTMRKYAMTTIRLIEDYDRANALAAEESDPARRQALEDLAATRASQANDTVDDFIADCQSPREYIGAAKYPGAYVTLKARFKHLRAASSDASPKRKIEAALAMLEAIVGVFDDKSEILKMAARRSQAAYGPGFDDPEE